MRFLLALGAVLVRIGASAPVRRVLSVAIPAAAIAALVLGVGAACLVRIPPGTVGVLQHEVGGRGIAGRDHGPGIVFRLPLVESWHLLDARTKVLSFGWESEGGTLPVLDLRTRDGATVKIGAAVVHRIRRGEAWQIVSDGAKGAWPERVRTAAEEAIAGEVGKLTAAELCDAEARMRAAADLERDLELALAKDHVQVETVLLTQVWFGGPYEQKLQKRQLAEQQELLLAAAIEVEARRGRIEVAEVGIANSIQAITAGLDQRIAERAVAGRSEVASFAAATRAYAESRRASAQAERDALSMEGDRLVARAESLKESLMRKALAGPGGRFWLARTAAENLNIRQVTLNSNDPAVPSILDLDRIVKLLVGADAPARP